MAPRRSDRRRPWNGVGEPAPVASGNAVGERGFAIWWPANVIGDGMPLFFKTGTGDGHRRHGAWERRDDVSFACDGHVWKTSAAGAILLFGAVLRDRARGTQPVEGLLPEPTGVVTADYVPHALCTRTRSRACSRSSSSRRWSTRR